MTRLRSTGPSFPRVLTILMLAFEALATAAVAQVANVREELTCSEEIPRATGSYQFVEEDEPEYTLQNGLTIGDVYLTRLEIFDESNPRENNWLFRWANGFHVLTKEETIRRDLLFESGDLYKSRVLEETARILRERGHLYDAAVRPVRRCGDEVDVEVITKDVWSFTPEISYDRSGGESSYRFGIAESNLFGTGRDFSFAYDNDIDRTTTRFVYSDDNIGGQRLQTTLDFTNADDGFHQFGLLQLPFYSLDSRRAWRISLDKLKQDENQYFRGEEVSSVRHEIEQNIVSYGLSKGLVGDKTRRWEFGYFYRRDRFSEVAGEPPPDDFPIDKKLSFPFIRFTEIEDNYATAYNLDQIHRTEDLHLGHTIELLLGPSMERFGGDQDRIIARGSFEDTLIRSDKTLLQHDLRLRGMWNLDTKESEDVIADYEIRYFRSQTTHRSFFASLGAVWTENYNPYRQVELGGVNGARAFDNRFQVGDRKVLLTLEERQYTDVHIMNLLRVGFAAFVDVGRAWEPGEDSGLADDWLADVGLGVRLASSKSNLGQIIHIDVAFPLTNRDDPAVDNYLIAVNIKDTF